MKIGQNALHKKPNQDDALIPLINIVFLMLIFFMVAGNIGEAEPLKVQPPGSVSDKQQPPEQLVIIVGTDGQIAFEQDIVTKEALSALITQRFDETADENKQAFNLLVKVDGTLPVEQLKEVLGVIKESGIKRVSLATRKIAESHDS